MSLEDDALSPLDVGGPSLIHNGADAPTGNENPGSSLFSAIASAFVSEVATPVELPLTAEAMDFQVPIVVADPPTTEEWHNGEEEATVPPPIDPVLSTFEGVEEAAASVSSPHSDIILAMARALRAVADGHDATPAMLELNDANGRAEGGAGDGLQPLVHRFGQFFFLAADKLLRPATTIHNSLSQRNSVRSNAPGSSSDIIDVVNEAGPSEGGDANMMTIGEVLRAAVDTIIPRPKRGRPPKVRTANGEVVERKKKEPADPSEPLEPRTLRKRRYADRAIIAEAAELDDDGIEGPDDDDEPSPSLRPRRSMALRPKEKPRDRGPAVNCIFCEHIFQPGASTVEAMYKHMRKQHSDLEGTFFICKKCNTKFRSPSIQLMGHHKKWCEGEIMFHYDPIAQYAKRRQRVSCGLGQRECPFCGKDISSAFGDKTPSARTLSMHLRKEHRDVPGTFFKCSNCPTILRRRDQCVADHIRNAKCTGRIIYFYNAAPATSAAT